MPSFSSLHQSPLSVNAMALVLHGESTPHQEGDSSLPALNQAHKRTSNGYPPENHGLVDQQTSHPHELSIWRLVETELGNSERGEHGLWWNERAGKALATMLHNAGYPQESQYRDLKFFSEAIAPYLGVSRQEAVPSAWHSFMTDDGTTIEFSWDWGTNNASPIVRYSIEPVGLGAGTRLDPDNLAAGIAFEGQLLRSRPLLNLEWFRHFKDFFQSFQVGASGSSPNNEDHKTSIFYGFDLSPGESNIKAYFFPIMRASAFGQSRLDVLLQAIQTAPHATGNNLEAAFAFQSFCSDPGIKPLDLEQEMLAIDLAEPRRARMKIYFRCRDTTFASLRQMMTLGGLINGPEVSAGLRSVQKLWESLFGGSSLPNQPLGQAHHRTTGLIYNAEFRLGDALPITKVYLPVRHYAASDDAVIQGLEEYFTVCQREKYMPHYVQTIKTLL